MSISIVDRDDLLDNELRPLAERRLLFALSRFGSRITSLEMVVSDENGPRGGIDKSARVSVSLSRAKDVVVTEQDADLARCVSRVAEKAGRAVARALERTRKLDRN